MSNFDKVATFYDRLARIVFGNEIKRSQTAQLESLKEGQRILIVGGGTGWILEELDKLQLPLEVDYVENSEKMIRLSEKRRPFSNLSVTFHLKDILEYSSPEYDVIMTHFFLDVFDDKSFAAIFDHTDSLLKPNGFWINTEFRYTDRLVQNLFIRFMYFFFRVTTNLQPTTIPDYQQKFSSAGFERSNSLLFFHQLIESCVYSRK